MAYSTNGYAQTPDVSQYVSNPHVYALARYGDIPVDHSTGVPAINIPLMSVSDRDITVDLSLSYHATGIKVDQEATWVGLGWVLNAGGIITRQVRGVQDSYDNTGAFIERPVIPDYDYQSPVTTYINSVLQDLGNIQAERADGEPDIFYYNFCGKTGKFILDSNAQACFFKHEDFEVEFQGNTKFIITDNLGVKYEFTTSLLEYVDITTYLYHNTWFLKKITGPAGGEISFDYDSSYSDYTRKRVHSTCYIETEQDYMTHSIDHSLYHASKLYTEYNQCALLSKITTKSGHYINFNLSETPRMDINSSTGKPLEEIILYNNKNEIQKKIQLGYGYFEANHSRKYKSLENTSPPEYNHLNYRLKLETVREISASGEQGALYGFEYYGDNNPATDDPYTLPYRMSPSQDHWGYYNDRYNNTIFPNNPGSKSFPTDRFLDFYIGIGSTFSSPLNPSVNGELVSYSVTGGANRDPDFEAVKAGTLKKIIYPTGGYTEFDFEAHMWELHNDLPVGGGLRIKQTTSNDGNGNSVTKEYDYEVSNLPSLEHHYVFCSVSPYHTLYYNPYDANALTVVPQILMTAGVPPEIAVKEYAVVIRVHAASPLQLGIGQDVLYDKVTEKISGGGRTEYHYACINSVSDSYTHIGQDDPEDAFTFAWIQPIDYQYLPANCYTTSLDSYSFPFPEPISNEWKNRLLTCKQVYREDETLISEDSISYIIESLHTIPTYKVCGFGEHEYLYARSYTTGGSVKVSKEVSLQYIPGQGTVCSVKEYDYSSPQHKQLTESRTWNSLGELSTTQYYYPTEYETTLSGLTSNHILKPVDIRTYKGDKLVSGVQTQYNDAGQEVIKYQFDAITNDIPFNSQSPYSFSPYLWNTYYPDGGLLCSQQTNSELSTVYLWGYNRQYPVAKIENATLSDVTAKISTGIQNSIADKNEPSASDWNTLNNLRTNLPNAFVTTYTYKLLVGVTSIIDPRGVKTTYEYDDFGRLKTIKDHYGYVVESYEYHYQNQ
jgi:YD repeat-containing protein